MDEKVIQEKLKFLSIKSVTVDNKLNNQKSEFKCTI